MEQLTLNLPAMYADHHVTEVRRILFELAGVDTVYASSSFHTVEVTFDPAQIDAETITAALEDTGYADTPVVPVEKKFRLGDEGPDGRFFRHTEAYANVGNTVSFAQQVYDTGRPLWPCPGMGVIKVDANKEDMADG
jgi:copper chaperone CopZ